MVSTEANQNLTSVVGVFRRPGDGQNPIHSRWSWRPIANAAIVVLLLSCFFTFPTLADEKTENALRNYKLGQEYNAKGQYRKAIGYHEKALAINREVLGEKHPNTARDYNNLGVVLNSLGNYRKAIGFYEKALAINREALGEKHPETARNYHNLGFAWRALGQYRKAIGYYEKALVILRGAFPSGHPYIRVTEANLAKAKKRVRK